MAQQDRYGLFQNGEYGDELVRIDHLIESATTRQWINRYKRNQQFICNEHADILIKSSETFKKAIIISILKKEQKVYVFIRL